MKTSEHSGWRKQLFDFVSYLRGTEDAEWQKERRLSFLRNEQKVVLATIAKIEKEYADAAARHDPLAERMIAAYSLPDWKKMAGKLASEIYYLETRDEMAAGITPEQIERARAYPLENLLPEINKQGYALCINHDDAKPSMFTRGNFCYCFSCQWTGDSIAVAMKLKNLTFPNAVRFLAGG